MNTKTCDNATSDSVSCSAERLPRQVIEERLLAALGDDECVAIVLNRSDLSLLIDAMDARRGLMVDRWSEQRGKMRADLIQLQIEAFGS